MKPIAPYHKAYHKACRSFPPVPEPIIVEELPEELRTAITEGCHPRVPDIGVSASLFAVLIALVDLDLSDEQMHGLMLSDYPIADISRHQHAKWRQWQIDTARQRLADCQHKLTGPMKKDPVTSQWDRDPSKQPAATFDNIRRELYGRLGIERLRHDKWSGAIVIDHNHAVLTGNPTVEEVWAKLGEGPDGITILCSTLGVYLAKLADASPFDRFYEMMVRLILQGRAEIARREGNGEVLDMAFLESLIPTCFKLKSKAVGRAASRLLLREKMAFAMVPPTQNRPVKSQALLLLAGYGGVGKSLFTCIMANGNDDIHDPVFGEDLCYDSFDFTKIPDRDRFHRIGKAAVAEVKEGLGFKKDSDHVKAEADRKGFSFDPKFRSVTVTYFRRYLMIMTTEDTEPLNRAHAWRRWLVVNVEDSEEFQRLRDEGRPEEHQINAEWLVSNYAVLNALAYDLLPWDESLRLSDADLKAVKEDNERHVTIDNWELALIHDLEPVMKDKARDNAAAKKFQQIENGEDVPKTNDKGPPAVKSWFHGDSISRWAESRSFRPASKELSALLQRLGFKRTGLRGEKVDGTWKYKRDWLTADLDERTYKAEGRRFDWVVPSIGKPSFMLVDDKGKEKDPEDSAIKLDEAIVQEAETKH